MAIAQEAISSTDGSLRPPESTIGNSEVNGVNGVALGGVEACQVACNESCDAERHDEVNGEAVGGAVGVVAPCDAAQDGPTVSLREIRKMQDEELAASYKPGPEGRRAVQAWCEAHSLSESTAYRRLADMRRREQPSLQGQEAPAWHLAADTDGDLLRSPESLCQRDA